MSLVLIDGSDRYPAISGDGSLVVGWSESAQVHEAFRWTRDRGIESLGTSVASNGLSEANAASYDGSVIVGRFGVLSGDIVGFRWTASDGMISIGDLVKETLTVDQRYAQLFRLSCID